MAMPHQPGQPQRPLTLTEELEKLEQSITLTLQGRLGPYKQTNESILIESLTGRNRPQL